MRTSVLIQYEEPELDPSICWITILTDHGFHCSKHFLEAIIAQLVKKVPWLLWIPEVHYHIHKSPPLNTIMSQMNPVKIIIRYFLKIGFNIIWTLCLRSPSDLCFSANILCAFLAYVLYTLFILSFLATVSFSIPQRPVLRCYASICKTEFNTCK